MARAAVFGASGAMGRCVVNSLARDDRIGSVVAVVRTEQPAAFWFLEGDPAWAKVEVLVVPDITQTPTIRCDFGFCCIGVYTGVPEAKFREVEVGLNTKAAEAMKAAERPDTSTSVAVLYMACVSATGMTSSAKSRGHSLSNSCTTG